MGLHGDGEAGDDSVSGFSLSPPPILRCPETSQDSNVADIECLHYGHNFIFQTYKEQQVLNQ